MKRKLIGATVIIAAVCIFSATQSMDTSDLEATYMEASYVEPTATLHPTDTTQPLITPKQTNTVQPTRIPQSMDTPHPTETPLPVNTPSPTITPMATKEPIKKEGIITSSFSVNIRSEASTNATIIGKLYTGAVLTIENEKNGWCYISSGKIKGYVSSDLITCSDKIEELKKKYLYSYAVVNVKLLNVRSKASTNADIVAKLEKSSEHKVLSVTDQWVHIAIYNTDMTGYVSKEFVTVKSKQLSAVSAKTDQIRKQSMLMKLSELQAVQNEATRPTVTPQPTSSPNTKPAVNATTNPTAKPSTKPTSKPIDSVGKTLTNSKEDQIKLLACIIYCEAGYDNYNGKLAVANVILNRVKSSRYPNTVKAVVYQKNQFSPVTSGRLQTQLKNYSSYCSRVQKECIQAAKDALAGNNNVGNRTSFRSARLVSVEDRPDAIQIGAHVFW